MRPQPQPYLTAACVRLAPHEAHMRAERRPLRGIGGTEEGKRWQVQHAREVRDARVVAGVGRAAPQDGRECANAEAARNCQHALAVAGDDLC